MANFHSNTNSRSPEWSITSSGAQTPADNQSLRNTTPSDPEKALLASNTPATDSSEDHIPLTPTASKAHPNPLTTQPSHASSFIPPPPPDGGRIAWTQTFITHLVVLNTWGFISSFGVFQTYYVEKLQVSTALVSLIGATQLFLLFLIGAFTGRLTDAGYFRQVFLYGSILTIIGIFTTSACTKYWQVMLAQAVCMGIGNGMLFVPTLSLLSTYFDNNRSLAMGIAASGSATGGIIFPVMFQQLLPSVGFGWATRSIAFFQMACFAVCYLGVRTRLPPRRAGPLLELGAFREKPYLFFTIGMFFNFWGAYIAFYFVGSFGRNIVKMSYPDSINLLLVMNGVGIVGRILPNYLADRFTGPLNLMFPSCAICGMLLFCWIAVGDQGGLYGWAVMYGLGGAAVQGLFPAVLSSLNAGGDLKKGGTRMGQVFTIGSFAVLTGPPIAGALISMADGKYLYAQVFAGSCFIVGTCFLVAARVAKVGWVLRARV